jgi:hypothetical protein
MSEMITIRAINTNDPAYGRHIQASRDTRFALDALDAIVGNLPNPEARARATDAIETLRAALRR